MDDDKWMKKQFIWSRGSNRLFLEQLPSDLFVDSALCLQTTASTNIFPYFTLSFLKSCLNLLSTTKHYKSDCCKMPAGQ